MRKLEPATTREEHRAAVLRALDYILRAIDSPTRLAEIATVGGFSPHYLNRLFSGLLGESIMELSRRVRLERAAYRLRESRDTVSAVAYEAGFDSYEAFSRAFRTAFGVAPSAYRRRVGLPPTIASRSGVHWSPGGGIGALSPLRSGEVTVNYEVKEFAPIRVAGWRHIGPHYSIHETWERLQSLLEVRGWTDARCFSVFLNSPADNPPERLETDVCFSVPADFERQEGLHLFELPGGDYASFRHHGVDVDLAAGWNGLFAHWLPASGRECVGPCFEEYVGGWSPQIGSITTEVYVGVR